MAAANFPRALAAVLKSEGGNDDDPSDHGGRTSRGITQREYDAWCRENKLPVRDVWKAEQTEISRIYKEEYWDPYCDNFPNGVDYLYFDMAVNAGPHRADILLQRALGVLDDGRIGPITRAAAAKADARILIGKFSDAKRAFYKGLHQPKFTKGWLNRTAEVQKTALAFVSA